MTSFQSNQSSLQKSRLKDYIIFLSIINCEQTMCDCMIINRLKENLTHDDRIFK